MTQQQADNKIKQLLDSTNQADHFLGVVISSQNNWCMDDIILHVIESWHNWEIYDDSEDWEIPDYHKKFLGSTIFMSTYSEEKFPHIEFDFQLEKSDEYMPEKFEFKFHVSELPSWQEHNFKRNLYYFICSLFRDSGFEGITINRLYSNKNLQFQN